MKDAEKLRKEILDRVSDYYKAAHRDSEAFIPGTTRVPYSGRVYDQEELRLLVDSALEFWLTSGRFSDRFENEFARFLGIDHCCLVNSGSSANLLAFMTLTSGVLGDRRISRGDEVITVAAGFPTTIAPVIQYGAIPVLVDVDLPTYNIDCSQLEGALSSRTRAVMLAHTLGNPFDLDKVVEFCRANNLWLIEDNCDALGSRYRGKLTGTFGDLGTSSFYPPHHITMGEGGAVYTDSSELAKIVLSLRDWGRDCTCPPGKDNTCGKRHSQQFGELPFGYDHKYVYSHFGYNLKLTDLQAAVGCAQLGKLPSFIHARTNNFAIFREALKDLEEFFILPEPTPGSEPSWFGFPLTVRDSAPFTRNDIVNHLENKLIQTRMLFAGNLLRHPCFDELRISGNGFRVSGTLDNTDRIMSDTFWFGVYPGLTGEQIDYIIENIHTFTRSF